MFEGWNYITNLEAHYNGRVLIAWRPDYNKVNYIISFVYAFNTKEERRTLWQEIITLSSGSIKAWLVVGDFNSVLSSEDRMGGNPVTWAELVDFKTCIYKSGLMELAHNGQIFTWNDKGEGQRIYSKIDWMFINNEWLHSMSTCKAIYLAEEISDHFPINITMGDINVKQRRTFKYCNVWSKHTQFLRVIEKGWEMHVEGCKTFQVLRKMKLLKRELRKLNTQHYKNIVTEA
ncbi:uncharacterized protein LOC142167387 [Nicotiana tabacum]|uniref:Uncharacterized protein LOC142167387 n=1 Tax=Nicotiana tabacum TaxID=4097 RepID=A0AC58SFA5_TOBAC